LLLLALIGGLLLVSLVSLLFGSLLLRGLLLLLLHRLLLVSLLLLHLRGRLLTVVVIVAAADQCQAGGADTGAGGRPEQRAARHASPAHPLPVVSLTHWYLL